MRSGTERPFQHEGLLDVLRMKLAREPSIRGGKPLVFTFLGYGWGIHAPARKNSLECMRATLLVNLAQGQAFTAIKAVNPKLQVGAAFSMSQCQAATSLEEDRKAADRAHALGNE